MAFARKVFMLMLVAGVCFTAYASAAETSGRKLLNGGSGTCASPTNDNDARTLCSGKDPYLYQYGSILSGINNVLVCVAQVQGNQVPVQALVLCPGSNVSFLNNINVLNNLSLLDLAKVLAAIGILI
jgi:hypothetical protein